MICSGVTVAGDIRRLCFAFAPATDRAEKIDSKTELGKDKIEPGKDDIEVRFENLEEFLGTPAPFRIFLGRVTSLEKSAPYWSVKQTSNEDEANMEDIDVVVTLGVSATLRALH